MKVKKGRTATVDEVVGGTELDNDAAIQKFGLSRGDTVRLYSFDIEIAPPSGPTP